MEGRYGRGGWARLKRESRGRIQPGDGVYQGFIRRAEAEPRLEVHTQVQRTSLWPDRDGTHASLMAHAGSPPLRRTPLAREGLSLDDAADWSSQHYQVYFVTDTLE